MFLLFFDIVNEFDLSRTGDFDRFVRYSSFALISWYFSIPTGNVIEVCAILYEICIWGMFTPEIIEEFLVGSGDIGKLARTIGVPGVSWVALVVLIWTFANLIEYFFFEIYSIETERVYFFTDYSFLPSELAIRAFDGLDVPEFVVTVFVVGDVQSFADPGAKRREVQSDQHSLVLLVLPVQNKRQSTVLRLRYDVAHSDLLIRKRKRVPFLPFVPAVKQCWCTILITSHHQNTPVVSNLIDITTLKNTK